MAWSQYAAILAEAAATLDAEQRARPAACPNDGQPLDKGPDGYLFCRFDGWNERDHPC